jgi:hypothetical protein
VIPEIMLTFGLSAAGERAVIARADRDLLLIAGGPGTMKWRI